MSVTQLTALCQFCYSDSLNAVVNIKDNKSETYQ